jgi:ribosomal protein S18 acetylase RimI-like enzyme
MLTVKFTMPLSNFERMIQLADEVFATREDLRQLDINEQVLNHLRSLHPATVSEWDDGQGPVAWVLVIPTTQVLKDQFLNGSITEKELYEQTPVHASYDTVYLCSAMVLEEYRKQGLARRLTVDAVEAIKKDHPITSLFVWTFSHEGLLCAEAVARETHLSLSKRIKK